MPGKSKRKATVIETTRIRRGRSLPETPIQQLPSPVPPPVQNVIPVIPGTPPPVSGPSPPKPIPIQIPSLFAPPPPPKPTTICDVLGTVKRTRGSTVPRGVSFACGGIPIDFSTPFPNNTTRRIFGAQIQKNRAKVKAAGITLPPSQAEKASAKRRVKILRKKQRSCGRDTNCIVSFGNQITSINKTFGI